MYALVGNFDGAIGLYQKAVKIDPGYAKAHYNLSVAYYQNGDYSRAREHADKAGALGYKISPKFSRLLLQKVFSEE